jgi:hypothetical protein
MESKESLLSQQGMKSPTVLCDSAALEICCCSVQRFQLLQHLTLI